MYSGSVDPVSQRGQSITPLRDDGIGAWGWQEDPCPEHRPWRSSLSLFLAFQGGV